MKKLILIILICFTYQLNAQKFVDINPFPYHQTGLIVTPQYGDVNADGWLDVLANGKVYMNDQKGGFMELYVYPIAITPYYQAYINTVLGDYDNDGFLDILATYKMNDNKNYTKILKNTGRDSAGYWLFYDIGANITGISNIGFVKSLQWGDYDNDGDLDILILGNKSGSTETTPYTDIYKNDKGVFIAINAGFTQFRDGTASFIDYDGDGDLDVILTGNTTEQYATSAYTRVYNNNNGVFTDSKIDLLEFDEATVVWGDYDQDGKPDVFITGANMSPNCGLYHNDGKGKFSLTTNKFNAKYWGDASWGDFDNDGDLDLIISGEPFNTPASYYRNDDGVFTMTDSIASGRISVSSPGDFDNDGDLDLLYSSFQIDKNNVYFSIYRNDLNKKNTAPSIPANLKSNVNGNNVVLTWANSTDAETKSPGLTYNIYVGDIYNKISIVTPMAGIATGIRMSADYGNCQQNISRLIKGLPDGKYYWSVQSIDNGFLGSRFAPEQTFTIGNPQTVDTLKIGAPNGGEIFKVNDAVPFKWEGLLAKDTVLVEFSSDNGTSWQTVTDKGINKLFTWNAPDAQSTKCLAKVSSFAKMDPKIIQRFEGLPSFVQNVKYSKSGKKLVTYSLDSNFRIWDIYTGTETAKFRNYRPSNVWTGFMESYAEFSDDDSKIVTVEQYTPNCFVTVWNGDASKILYELLMPNDQYLIFATISPDNKYLAVAHGIDVKIYDLNAPASHDPFKTINISTSAYAFDIAYSNDGNYIGASLFSDSSLVLINTKTWDVMYKATMNHKLLKLDFNHSGSKILLTDDYRNMIIWDIATHKTESTINIGASINDATFSNDDGKIFYVTNEYLSAKYIAGIYDLKSNRILCNLFDNKPIVGGMFSPDMNYAVTTDSIVKIWQLNPIAPFSDISDATWTIMKDVSVPFLELTIDTVIPKVNDIIELPIRLKNSTNLNGSGVTGIRTTLSFNGNVLFPAKNTPNGLLNGSTREIQIDLPISPIENNILAKLSFEVLLGDAESTNVSFKNPTTIGATSVISEHSGLITISNICKDGGVRLVQSGNSKAQIEILPNPANDFVTIYSDKEMSNLKIFDNLGVKIDEYVFKSNNFKIDLRKYQTGFYLLNINNDINFKSLLIIK